LDPFECSKDRVRQIRDILEKTQKKLQEASNTIEDAARKSRGIEKRLKNVQALPTADAPSLLETLTISNGFRQMEKKSLFKKIAILSFLGIMLFVALHFFYPDVSTLKKNNLRKTAFMEYREEEWRREGKNYRVQQTWVPYRAISPYLVKAVLIGRMTSSGSMKD